MHNKGVGAKPHRQADGQWQDAKNATGQGEIPNKPDVYNDGSVHNPRSLLWQVGGGVGVYWPAREEKTAPLTEIEKYIYHEGDQWGGMKLWNVFTDSKNISSRCEIGAALVAVVPLGRGEHWHRQRGHSKDGNNHRGAPTEKGAAQSEKRRWHD